MINQVLSVLNERWFATTVAIVALLVALAGFVRQGRRWKREAYVPPPVARFFTGPMPFSPEWRQAVLDIKDTSADQFTLIEFSAKRPADMVLALGFNGDTNRGPDAATEAKRHIVEMKAKTWAATKTDKAFTYLSFDVFYRADSGIQSGSTLAINILLSSSRGGNWLSQTVECEVPSLKA